MIFLVLLNGAENFFLRPASEHILNLNRTCVLEDRWSGSGIHKFPEPDQKSGPVSSKILSEPDQTRLFVPYTGSISS